MADVPKIKLNTGALMPAIGLGGWGGMTKEERSKAWQFMLLALKSGFRLIDTAWSYETETSTARAIKESGIPRDQIWITTKLHHQHHGPYVEKYFEDSLKKLETDYVDLYLIHWPMASMYDANEMDIKDEEGNLIVYNTPIFNETWARMEKLYESGKAKAIGVSNFSVKNLKKLMETAKVVPAVNQVELNPFLVQQDLKDYCDEKGIVLTAFACTAWNEGLNDPTIVELAGKYKVTPAQVIYAWHIARGHSFLSRSSKEDRLRDSLNLPTLSPEDVERITSLNRPQRFCNPPNEHRKVCGWTLEQLGW